MATHDYIISNASGAAVRADLNNALAAIVTNNSSATAPTTTYAYQWWADTGSSPAVMKLRNAANSAWITLFQLDGEWTNIAFENGSAAAPSIYFKDSGTDTGLFSPGTDQVAISTGGTQRTTVDSSGKLLVGTSTARSNFYGTNIQPQVQIETANSATRSLSILSSASSDAGGLLILAAQKSGAVGGNTAVASTNELGQIGFLGSDGTNFILGATIQAVVDGTPGTNDMPGRLVFSTRAVGGSSPDERMRLSTDGQIFFGCTGQTGAAAAPNQDGGTIFQLANGNKKSRSDIGSHWQFFHSTSVVGSITTTASSTAYNTSSDYRLKENIAPLSGALDRLGQLQVHRFNFIADPDKTVDGFIAHEAQSVVPECVSGTKDEVDENGDPVYQGIDQSKIVPLLTAALQEAIAKIETLEAKVAALEAA
jgi:hypothetical protein